MGLCPWPFDQGLARPIQVSPAARLKGVTAAKLTEPQTQAGRDKIAVFHTAHGRLIKEKRQEAKKRTELGSKVRAKTERIEASLIEHGMLESYWCKDWKL